MSCEFKKRVIKNKYYVKVIISVLLLALLPVPIVSLISYYNIQKTLDGEIHQWNIQILKNSSNAMEVIIDEVFKGARYMVVSNVISDYESMYNSNRYENNSASFFGDNVSELVNYLYNKSNVVKMMRTVKINNKYIEDIFFLDEGKKMILTTEGSQYTTENFYDLEWYEKYKGTSSFPLRMNTRSINKKGIYKNVITIIYKTFKSNSAFIINIDVNELYKSTFSAMHNDSSEYYICNEQGRIIMGSDSDKIMTNISEYISQEFPVLDSSFTGIIDGLYVVTSVKSEKLGWHFISVKDISAYNTNINNLKLIIIFSGLLILIFMSALALLLSKSIYLPVTRVLKSIRNSNVEIGTEKEIGEMEYIEKSFQKVLNQKKSIEQKYTGAVPLLRDIFRYEMIKYNKYSKSEIIEKLNELDPKMPVDNFFLVLIHVNRLKDKIAGFKERNMVFIQVKEIIETMFSKKYNAVSVNVDENMCVLINANSNNFNEIKDMIIDVKNRIEEEMEIDISVVSGGFCPGIYDLNTAYNRALDALKYQIVCGREEVLFTSIIQNQEYKHLSYPSEMEKTLNSYIISGNYKGANKILKYIIDKLISPSGKSDVFEVRICLTRLIASIMTSSDILGLNFHDIFEMENDVVSEYINKTSKDNLLESYSRLILQIIEKTSVNEDRIDNDAIKRIKGYIDKNFTRDISLDNVADLVGMNPSYVSRLIKAGIGETFTKYLSDKRINEAKRLLLESESSVDDISQRVGFNKTCYFIKVFKQYTGDTPGKYRVQMKNISRND